MPRKKKEKKEGSEHLQGVFYVTFCLGEGNGTPLQYSCLENPMDRGAW